MQTAANNPLFRPFFPAMALPFPRPGEPPHPAAAAAALHPAFFPAAATHPHLFPPGALAALRHHPPPFIPHPDGSHHQQQPKPGKSFTIDAILGGQARDGCGPPGYARVAGDMGPHSRGGAPEAGDPLAGLNGQCSRSLRYGRAHPLSITKGISERKSSHPGGALSPQAWKHSKSKRVRTIFTPEQLERLEAEFERQQYMVGTERYYLAASLNLTEAQVKVWFQNRRIKWRKQNLEQQHAKLANMELYSGEEGSDSDEDTVAGSHDNKDVTSLDVVRRSDILEDVEVEQEEEVAVDLSNAHVQYFVPDTHSVAAFGGHLSTEDSEDLYKDISPGS